MANPGKAELFDFAFASLIETRNDLRTHGHDVGDDEAAETDVRLGVDNGAMQWREGDVQFDTRHFEHCAASSCSWDDTNDDLRNTARDLADQIVDSYAESEV